MPDDAALRIDHELLGFLAIPGTGLHSFTEPAYVRIEDISIISLHVDGEHGCELMIAGSIYRRTSMSYEDLMIGIERVRRRRLDNV